MSLEPVLIRRSFTVFDYTKKGRKSYYHPTATASSMATGTTLAPSTSSIPVRSASPGEKTQLCSNTGLDIEAQIADGGGVAAMRAGETDFSTPTTAAPTPLLVSQKQAPSKTTSRQDNKRNEEDIPMARLVSNSSSVASLTFSNCPLCVLSGDGTSSLITFTFGIGPSSGCSPSPKRIPRRFSPAYHHGETHQAQSTLPRATVCRVLSCTLLWLPSSSTVFCFCIML